MTHRRLGLSVSVIAAVVAAFSFSPASAAGTVGLTVDDAQLQAMSTTVGGVAGAPALKRGNTVAHWCGATTKPNNGITYGYNMVGAAPSLNSSTTVEVDITPVDVNVGGRSYIASSPAFIQAILDSHMFANNDYGSTPFGSGAGAFPNAHLRIRGAGGALSQGDAGNQLELEDATMRAQFNQTGTSGYHVKLHANVLPAVTVDVPSTQGTLLTTGRGVTVGDVNITWWATRIQNLIQGADPTHLPVILTNDVLLHIGPNPLNCCVIGFHGAGIVPGKSNGSVHGNGSHPEITYAWASWVPAGFYARARGGTRWCVPRLHSPEPALPAGEHEPIA